MYYIDEYNYWKAGLVTSVIKRWKIQGDTPSNNALSNTCAEIFDWSISLWLDEGVAIKKKVSCVYVSLSDDAFYSCLQVMEQNLLDIRTSGPNGRIYNEPGG